MEVESVTRIEPARLEEPTAEIADVIADLSAAAATLGRALHPRTAANLVDLVRIMNTYYSNLIEGHDTRPRDIERALAGEFDQDQGRRDLQMEAAAHVRVQAEIDRLSAAATLPAPASGEFLQWLHREFYRDAPESMLAIQSGDRRFTMEPGAWRHNSEHDVAVGRHVPPSSERVADFMQHFESRFRFDRMGKAAQIMAIASAHHRFNYIHPFPDGNGRVFGFPRGTEEDGNQLRQRRCTNWHVETVMGVGVRLQGCMSVRELSGVIDRLQECRRVK
jgi:Fic family protein